MYIYVYICIHIWSQTSAAIGESCHTISWVVSHKRMSHVTHFNESCQIWMNRLTHIDQTCHTWKSHDTHVNMKKSWHTCEYEKVMTHMWFMTYSHLCLSYTYSLSHTHRIYAVVSRLWHTLSLPVFSFVPSIFHTHTHTHTVSLSFSLT